MGKMAGTLVIKTIGFFWGFSRAWSSQEMDALVKAPGWEMGDG
jgi:hypothetical protein